MNLKSWCDKKRGRAGALAEHLRVSAAFMSDMVNAVKPIPVAHCKAIEAFTDGEVTCIEMRPTDWRKYWPELAQAPTNTAPPATEAIAEQGA
jgi:DNA-binding transcriptional regulator YdaS (Cro superfamily)